MRFVPLSEFEKEEEQKGFRFVPIEEVAAAETIDYSDAATAMQGTVPASAPAPVSRSFVSEQEERSLPEGLAKFNRAARLKSKAEQTPGGLIDTAKDMGLSFLQGAMDVTSLPIAAYEQATGDKDSLLRRFFRRGQEAAEDLKSDKAKANRAATAAAIEAAETWQEALAVGIVEGFSDPSNTASTLARMVPQLVAGGGLGRAAELGTKGLINVARGAPVAAAMTGRAAGLAEAGASAVGAVQGAASRIAASPVGRFIPSVATAGAVGGAAIMQGDSVGEEVYKELTENPQIDVRRWAESDPGFQPLFDELMKTPVDEIRDDPVFQQKLSAQADFLPPEKDPTESAKRAWAQAETIKGRAADIANSVARKAAAISLGTAALPGGSAIETALLRRGGAAGASRGLLERMTLGGLKEGLASEPLEEGGGAFVGAQGKQQAGLQVDPLKEAASAAGQAVAPATIAGGVSSIPGGRAARLAAEPAPSVQNFTPPDSPTKQAGLVDIVVPTPGAAEINPSTEQQFGLDKLRMGGVDVGTAGVPGGLVAAGGGGGGSLAGGSLGAAGPGVLAAAGGGGGAAQVPGAGDRPALPAGGAAGEQAAGVAAPAKIWAGRAGDGYMQDQDAQQALPGLQRKYPDLTWNLQQDADGKFFWAGTTKETDLGTQTPQAQQAQAPGAAAAGQAAGLAQGGAGGLAAPARPAVELSDTERAGLRLAPTAPVRELKTMNEQLDKQLGVTFSPVRAADLTDSQRLASAVARLMGKTLTVVHQETGAGALPNGMINSVGGKHLFVADDADDAPLAITVHEAYHGLPEPQRKALNTALLDLFRQDRKDKFLDEFSYTPETFEEEAPAMMVQAISKREDFWQELRTKMGNKEFGEVAKTILAKLGDILTGAKKQYGEDFVNKYITDVAKARDLLTTAYADAMKAQGLQPDVEFTSSTGEPVVASARSRIGMDFKDVIKRTPELQAAAERVKAGEMTAAEYDKLVNEYKPVEPYTSVPQPAADTELRTALTIDKVDRIGVPSKTLKAGDPVGLRLDIPAYSNHGTWVVSVHQQESGYNAGKSIGYEPVAAATNVTFGVVEKAAMNIAGGKPKSTIAVIKGGWKPTTPAEAKLKADQALKSKDWVQVGMDPERHSYFYDRKTMEPVVKADEVIQVGPLVLAKNPTYGNKSDFMFSARAREPVKVSDYNPKADNFNNQRDMPALLAESVPAETIAAADGFVEKYFKERQPVSVSPEERLRAEILLKPKMAAAEQVKPEYDQKVLNIAARTGAAGQMLAPLKSLKRAAEKLAIEEGFQVDNIKDLLRSTIVVDSYADAPAIVDEIRKEFDVVRIKDRAGALTAQQGVEPSDRQGLGGYADVLINVRMPNGTLGEIQINTPAMLAAKDGQGHKLYEAAREQPDGSPLRAEIYDAMRGLYDAAFAAANLRQPSAQARNEASDIGAPRAGSEATGTSSSPESASLKTEPSGNETNSSPEKSATNLLPAGKEAGTFIEPPDAASVPQTSQAQTIKPRRGTVRVGEFDVRTMRDGTILVYGDSATIRAQIPEDVRGRVVPEGVLFVTSNAPRVRAALEGRKTAYSRGGQVTEKLPMKDGKYLGAPEKYNTPGKIVALRKQLRMLTLEGERGRYWYENSGLAILRMTGGNVHEARKFVALLAIYSPQARVDSNSTFALRAWAQYKAGQPISVKTGVQDKKATEAMADVDAFWSGEKTGNFFFNLLREIDTSTAGKQGATIDMWMMRAAEYSNDAPTATQYAFMENETNRIAQEMGWEPQQVQAAIWVAMKARMENKGVKQRTEDTSEKKGWIRFDYPMKNGRPFKTRVILKAQAHRDNWLKHAMEHVPTKEDTEQAKFDFADGVGRHIGQLSFEARPGRSTGILDGIHAAPYAQQVEFQQAVQRAFYDENGVDMLAVQLGLLSEPSDIMRPGVWQGDVSPSTQKRVAMAPAGGDAGKSNVDPAQAELLNVYASVAGLVARQEGVGWHRPFYAGTKRDANGLEIDIGRALNPAETRDLEAAIGKWMDDNKHADWQNSFALISSPTGIRVVNFGIITNGVLQSEIVKVAEGVLPDGSVRVFASSGDMPTNDWKANPNGQTYVQRISAAGRSDVLDWARSVLAPRVQRVFEQFAEKYQWGDPGRIQFSQRARSDEAGAGRDRVLGQGEVRGQVTPSYGTPREGAASAVGYHYSTQPRTSLSSAMYGAGLRGAEMARLEGADPRLKQRIYFYIDRGTGVNPEAGVGGQAHRVNLQNLYDADEDALRLQRDAGSFNAFESAVVDAGFDGYMVRDAGPSGNAVLLGQHSVPVEQLGAQGRMRGEQVAAARERVLSDAEKIANNKALPAGQVSGTRWAELVSRAMPDVYERLADSPVWQSSKPMYRSELARELRAQPMFSNRALPKVSPQSALNADITAASDNLARYVKQVGRGAQLPKLTIGRLPHVLNMLGARTQDFDIATSIVKKVFIEKHKDELPDITPKQLIEAIYRPAMVLKSKDGGPREFELVLPITNDKGAVIVPIKVSVDKTDPTGAVMSIYAKGVSISGGKTNEQVLMKRINDGNLLYLDPGLAKQALTGRKTGDAKLNGSFVSWPGVWPKLEKMISERRVKTDVNLMRWIGDNYKPSSSPQGWQDAPAFSRRVKTDTPEFKRWFGDSRAVVGVNAETGQPLVSSREPKKLVPQVMYHTTRNDFTEFEIGRITKNSGTFGDWETSRAAVFVTPELEDSEAYGKSAGRFASGANVMPLYIKAENPLDMTGGFVSQRVADQFEEVGINPRWLYQFDWSKFDDEDGKAFVEAAKKLGYDSVIFNDENPDTGDSFEAWALFEPTQIKSATGNSGAFDPANPDIRFSQRARAVSTEVPDQDVFEEFGRFAENRIDADRAWADGDHVFAVAEMDEEPTPVTSPQMLAAYTPDQLMIIRARDWSPSEPAAPDQAEVASLFRDLQDARGLGRVRALERVDAHPMAETIRRIDEEFMDILERLDDAGLVKINCK